ncbi:MAG: acyltransferase [Actinomycetota bacterium]|nr:acyltransferase [Actinomycetota bacterium]
MSTDIEMGDYSGLEYDCFVLNEATITIGARTAVGTQSMLVTGSHEVGDGHRRAGPPSPMPIVIGSGCWIGARVLVLPGVTIGDGCIIGAGSMVTSYCEPHGIYMGSPAVRIRDLQPPEGPPPEARTAPTGRLGRAARQSVEAWHRLVA